MLVLIFSLIVFVVIIAVPILQFISTLLHEIGHAFVAEMLGIPIEYVHIGSQNRSTLFSIKRLRFSLPSLRGSSFGHTQHTAVFTDTWRYECYALGGVVVTCFVATLFCVVTIFLFIHHDFITATLMSMLVAFLALNLFSLRAIPGRDGYHAKFLNDLRKHNCCSIRYITSAEYAYAETPENQIFRIGDL